MMRSGGKCFMAPRGESPGGEQPPPEQDQSGGLAKRLDMLGQALVLAIHEVVLHALRIAAGLSRQANGLGHFTDMHRARPAADAEIVDAKLIGLPRKGADLVAIAIERVERRREGPPMR